MTPFATTVLPGGLVLVTGVNGFIGSHIANSLLELGYRVRGTVRTEDKAIWIKEAMAERHPIVAFQTIIVRDANVAGAWDEAVKDVDGIVHVAGDMSFDTDPHQVITPMVNGVRNLLRAAANTSSVTRFVFTSSNRAISDAIIGQKVTLDATMWNEAAIERAWQVAPEDSNRIWDVYAALKTQCEQEVWRFGREEQPNFVINTVLPCFTVGPIFHPKQPGSTGKWVMDFWKDPNHSEPLRNFGASWYVDVQDAAALHIAGLMFEDVKNERLLGFAGPFNFNSWLAVFRQLKPEEPWPSDDPAQQHDLCTVDTTREIEILGRFGKTAWTSFYHSVKRSLVGE